ncbi:hypothetical protein [Gottfriedia luciferensis]|uniref:hypothetical protein n=1 Tax=Gottfriedia luciferensis TaxID=178774 RepID=UPI0011550092|nr:hypothetical protein [Gottfriedia luciferensis]
MKYFRLIACIFLLLAYSAFFGRFLHESNQKFYEYSIYGSTIIFFIICTLGALKFSKKFSKISYFFTMIAFVGWFVGNTYISKTVYWRIGDTYRPIEIGGIFMWLFILSLIGSFIFGVIAFIKGEKGLAKYSAVLLLLMTGLVYVSMFIIWLVIGGEF